MEKSLDYFPLPTIIVYMYRKQIEPIIKDLNKKIVFIVGPRQVGKTWLSLEIGKRFNNTTYLNYDSFEDHQIIKEESWLRSTELLILDELHKMPLSISELQEDKLSNDIERFIQRGGFPEPFLAEDEVEAKRWRNQYIDGLIRTDILDFERIHDFRAIQMVFELLRRRVGSPVSYASIARDVKASPTTIIKYIQVLEALYIIFRVAPYSRNIARSILKEPKIYFFDNSLVTGDDGTKFENFIAVSLLKHIYARNDYEGENFELKYIRTKDKKEIDFCLINTNEIEEVIEVKNRDSNISKNLRYFCKKYDLKGTQILKELKREKEIERISIRNAHSYLKECIL